ncbi:M48 family metallopeptidase [Aquella oligotrophica]|uniref:YgjP-like metallopeptidase domain-containing protein n=1 Tax=Aquella oligotrophica TaxID=2067065 RepID=A0A2I7N9E7_9NEIS|nr:SprT family zinc-dependent metalloprotease [Aquella oligotrophica]AUR52875.1 hypothetical protein CUN60_11410 [Aquella oligotrophica]
MEYEIIKSKRKTMAISINHDGMVVIRVPFQATTNNINDLIQKYQHWIDKKLAEVRSRKKDTGVIYFLGETYSLVLLEGDSPAVQIVADTIRVYGYSKEEHQLRLINWYKEQVKNIVQPLMVKYQNLYALKPEKVKVTKAKGRWGSCSSKGTISFSYRLIMLPLFVIEYIVAHELAHLRELNHSLHFWTLVANIYPEYKMAEKWLKNHRYLLADLFI